MFNKAGCKQHVMNALNTKTDRQTKKYEVWQNWKLRQLVKSCKIEIAMYIKIVPKVHTLHFKNVSH